MDKFTKKQQIKDLKEGQIIEDIFVVKIKKSILPYIRGYSFSLILSDSSGRSIEYKYWGNRDEEKIKEIFNSVKKDSVVLIKGKVLTYRDKLQISSEENEILKVLQQGEYEADFIIAPKKDIEEMYILLISKINSIQNESLKIFLLDIFQKEIGEKFKKHPGAISIHHNWWGGLLQHTLEVIEICEVSIKIDSRLNRDLLLTGAMLHDIGKLEELETTTRIKGSQKGQLIGHLTLGVIFLSEKLKESDIDLITKNKLMHLLVSHHGKEEQGSPKQPMIPEAVVLYYADELVTKLSEMIEFIEEHKEDTEDDFMYYSRKGLNIFLK